MSSGETLLKWQAAGVSYCYFKRYRKKNRGLVFLGFFLGKELDS